MTCRSLLAFAIAGAAMTGAWASENQGQRLPGFHLSIPIELQYDNTFDASLPGHEVSDFYLAIEPELELQMTRWLTFQLGLVFEPVEDVDPFEDRAFEDHGLFVEVAQFTFNFGQVTLNAGKFTAPFAIAYEYAPGIYGDIVAEEVEVTERIGFGGAFNFSGDGTDEGVIISAAAFRRDTSLFSGSIFTNRHRLSVGDGTPGNHDGLESFALALDLKHIEALPEFHIHAGFLHQAEGEDGISDQNAYVFGVNWEKKIGENAVYQLLFEWAHTEDGIGFAEVEPDPGSDSDTLTFAASGTWYERWQAAVSYNRVDGSTTHGPIDLDVYHASLGYRILPEWLAEVAYLYRDEAGDEDHTLGVRLTYELEFEAHDD